MARSGDNRLTRVHRVKSLPGSDKYLHRIKLAVTEADRRSDTGIPASSHAASGALPLKANMDYG